jgi:hypothetical protein
MRTGTCTVVPLHELTEPSSTSGWTVALESTGIKDRTQSSNKRRMLEENKAVSDGVWTLVFIGRVGGITNYSF